MRDLVCILSGFLMASGVGIVGLHILFRIADPGYSPGDALPWESLGRMMADRGRRHAPPKAT